MAIFIDRGNFMDRIYNKNNVLNRLNQSEAVGFSPVPKQPVRYNTGVLKGISVERSGKNKILNKLSNQASSIFKDALKPVYFTCRKQVYCPDEAIRFVYFPETAVFSEYKILEDGRMIEIIMTGKEGVTGVTSLFHAHGTENFTHILQAGHALQMDVEFLSKKLNSCPEIKELIFEYFNEFVNQISQRIICNGFHLIEHRLCSWLLMLHDRTGSSKLYLTHEQIALALGAHRPSITQITKKLRDAEIIDYMRGAIFILNRNKLEADACSCYVPVR